MSENLQKFLQKEEVVKTTLFKPSFYGGRFTRMQCFLYLFVGGLIYAFFDVILPDSEPFELIMSIISFLFSSSIAIKRAHDIGHKGTLIISVWCASLILALFIFLITFTSLVNSTPIALILLCAVLLLSGIKLIYGLILLFKDSQKGTNAYGPSIKYPDGSEREEQVDFKTFCLLWSNNKKLVTLFLLFSVLSIVGIIKFIPQYKAKSELEDQGIIPTNYAFALYDACEENNKQIVSLLLTAGADVNKANNYGSSPLHSAVENGSAEIVKMLIDAGADVNKANNYNGSSPLHSAVKNGSAEIVKMLIDAGADINKANNYNGSSPLHSAVKNGSVEIVKMLIDAGADVNKANNYNGMSPLHSAVENGSAEIVKMLIDARADVNKADKDGTTPLYWAESLYHKKIVELLKQAGAKK